MSYSYDYSPPPSRAVQKLHEEKQQRQQRSLGVPLDRTFDYDATIGAIINETPFASPIPLPPLVDALVDLWESDGLFE
jgi:hypothetical protein